MSRRSSAAWAWAVVLSLAANVAAEEPPPARKIIDRAIEAAGGRKALERYQKPFYMERKGKALGGSGWNEFTMKVTTWLPDKFRTDQEPITNPKNGPFGIRFNGERGFYIPTMKEMDAVAIRGNRDRLYGEWVATLVPLDAGEFQAMTLMAGRSRRLTTTLPRPMASFIRKKSCTTTPEASMSKWRPPNSNFSTRSTKRSSRSRRTIAGRSIAASSSRKSAVHENTKTFRGRPASPVLPRLYCLSSFVIS